MRNLQIIDHEYFNRKFIYLIVGFLLLLFLNAKAQDNSPGYVIVKGVIVEGNKPLNKSIINLYEDNKLIKEKTTGPNGKFMLKLELRKEYLLSFSKDAYVTKKISFSTEIPETENGIWEYKFSVGLFEMIEGLDISILDKPISKIKYYEYSADFDYDDEYTQSMIKSLERLLEQAEILKNSEYQSLIDEGDKLYSEKKYEEAIEVYDIAIDINPYSEYPDQKIYEITSYLRKKDAIDESYQRAITEADKNYNIENYQPALAFYQRALELKSMEEYPKLKISELEQLLGNMSEQNAESKKLEKDFRNAINDGDFALSQEKFEKAKEKYNFAINIKPDAQYPKDQLIALNYLNAEKLRKEASKEEIELAYTDALREADEYFNSNNYMEANDSYFKALTYKPNEKYPDDQISEINKIFQTQKVIDTKFLEYITNADAHYNTNQYTKAKAIYKKALSIKPNEKYPKDQILSIDSYNASLQSINENYNNIILNADRLFTNKDYPNAIESYNRASQIKPNEDYPKEQLLEIEKILLAQNNVLAEQQLLENQYNSTLEKADQLFGSKDYAGARVSYEMALSIKPKEIYPKEKIAEIESIIEKEKEIIQQYERIIVNADKKFNSKNYEQAKILYTDALIILPEKDYPKNRISEIDIKIKAILSTEELKQANEKEYKRLLSIADSLFAAKQYNSSKSQFEQALIIKPDENYPKTKIQNILAELDRINKLNQEYTTYIKSADGLFNAANYLPAKENYEKALALKPDEKYPKERIALSIQKNTELEQINANKKKIEEEYLLAIKTADNEYKHNQFASAKASYQEASDLKPDESYPVNKIKEIDDILYGQNQKKLAYDAELLKADEYFNSAEYEYATSYYEKALTILSNEEYPKTKIKEIKSIVEDLKQKRKIYDKTIATANKEFINMDYDDAKANYNIALGYIPNDEYATNKINEIINIQEESRLAKENTDRIDKGYKDAIARADANFNSAKHKEAKEYYQSALGFKSDELYPKSRILEIDDLLAKEKKEKENTYNRAIASADSYLFQKKYSAAKSQYNKALLILPDEEYPVLKLKEIVLIFEKEEVDKKQLKENEEQYSRSITEANNFYKDFDYVSAKASYQKALIFKSDASFPKKRLEEIDKLIRKQQLAKTEESKKETQEKIDASKSSFKADKDFDYSGEERKSSFLSDMAKKYPEGKTVENYNKPNKKILRIILNYNGVAKEYIKVSYSYGIFYFRNGQNISQGIFLSETKK